MMVVRKTFDDGVGCTYDQLFMIEKMMFCWQVFVFGAV